MRIHPPRRGRAQAKVGEGVVAERAASVAVEEAGLEGAGWKGAGSEGGRGRYLPSTQKLGSIWTKISKTSAMVLDETTQREPMSAEDVA